MTPVFSILRFLDFARFCQLLADLAILIESSGVVVLVELASLSDQGGSTLLRYPGNSAAPDELGCLLATLKESFL